MDNTRVPKAASSQPTMADLGAGKLVHLLEGHEGGERGTSSRDEKMQAGIKYDGQCDARPNAESDIHQVA